MSRYLLKQAVLSILKLFLFVSIMFFLIQVLMPGDFVDQFALGLTRAQRERLRVSLGMDLPLWQQYLNWIRGVFTGNLGTSGYGYPVSNVFRFILPATLFVFLPGTLISFFIGLRLGKVTAWKGRSPLSSAITLGGITLSTSFPPWLAWLIAYFFGRQATVSRGGTGGIRTFTFPNVTRSIWMNTDLRPHMITNYMFFTLIAVMLLFIVGNVILKRLTKRSIPGFLLGILITVITIGSWYLFGFEVLALDLLQSSALPFITYILLTFGETMTIMRSSMTEVLKEEYVTTARAKGLPASTVREKHVARNALLPVLSRLVITLPYLLTGIVIIEDSLNWPGVGSWMWLSLYWQDIPVVMGILLVVGFISLVARLFLDILAAYLDPRIRYAEAQPRLGQEVSS
ncbi:MAG: ABC transporter permease [Anaerolineaceae bacterium]|nr:MAG: ABC transporter permease [Anaerolineaceae bacterium]